MLQNKGIHVDPFDSVIVLEILVQEGKKGKGLDFSKIVYF